MTWRWQADLAERERAERILVPLRWLAIGSWLVTLQLVSDRAPLTIAAAAWTAAAGYGAITHLLVRSGHAGAWLPFVTAVGDTVFVALVCAVSGGTGSELYGYFYLPVLGASIRFDVGGTLAIAGLVAVETLVLHELLPGAPPAPDLFVPVFLLFFIAILGGILSREGKRHHREAIAERDRRRDLLWRLIHAEDEERKRIAGELHDRMGRRFFELYYGLQGYRETVGNGRGGDPNLLERLDAEAQACANEVRSLIDDLRPTVLDDFGFAEALRDHLAMLEEKSGLDVKLAIEDEAPSGRADIDVALFRILQEAVLNVRKHAGAKRVEVAFRRARDGALRLSIRDDGRGFDPAHLPKGHYGLLYMRERAEACGGRLEIDSTPGRGTSVVVEVPGQPARAEAR